jgi:hypothetical protein
MTSNKYPTRGKSRPYHYNPFDDPPPKWFDLNTEFYPLHCMHSYLSAIEEHAAHLSNRDLKYRTRFRTGLTTWRGLGGKSR